MSELPSNESFITAAPGGRRSAAHEAHDTDGFAVTSAPAGTPIAEVQPRGWRAVGNDRDLLLVRAARHEPLVIIPLRLATEIAVTAEQYRVLPGTGKILAQSGAGNPRSLQREQTRKQSNMSKIFETLSEQQRSPIGSAPPPTNLPAVPQQHLPANNDDGWEDTAAELESQFIRGTLLKFADWRWSKGKDGDEVEKGTQFLATGTVAAWVKWWDGKPVQHIKREPGRVLPDLDEMPDRDQSLWQLGPDGKLRDPWQNTRYVYLLDPISMEVLTFSTSSLGGRAAAINLADQIKRMRGLGRASALPVVELGAEKMPTRFGMKSRPVFKIVKWYGGESANGGGPKEIAPPSLEEEMNGDEIPF